MTFRAFLALPTEEVAALLSNLYQVRNTFIHIEASFCDAFAGSQRWRGVWGRSLVMVMPVRATSF